jgi:hypothetical protein
MPTWPCVSTADPRQINVDQTRGMPAGFRQRSARPSTDALSKVFWKYIDAPSTPKLNAVVAAMTQGKPITTATLGITGPTVALPATRAYGEPRG